MNKIQLKNVILRYSVYEGMHQSLKNSLFSFSVGGRISRNNKAATIAALDDISLDINEGDRVGIIGPNGAGKSTLLRVLAGSYIPQSGEVFIKGSVSTLFSPRLGMAPYSSGYENIYLRGLVMGFSKEQIDKNIDEIAEFSGLGEFLHLPIGSYSAGMVLRLAFAITTTIQPDILLMDEWLAVGDREFQLSARARLMDLVEKANILVLASHDLENIEKLCNKALFLRQGKIVRFGPVEEVVGLYKSRIKSAAQQHKLAAKAGS
jgi:ABC-type polysaccharide/polyol phosphate transport system ATPase subunit